MKKRVGVTVTYELLASLLGLEDYHVVQIINTPLNQSSETIDIIFSGPGGFDTPEGNTICFIPYDDIDSIKERAKNA